jgi:hypothetical protein
MATMLVSRKLDERVEHDPHAVRFRHLTALCFALGTRGCTAMLVHPGAGEAVLWVPFPRRPGTGLAVGAVESGGRWMFAYGGHSSAVDDVVATAVGVIAVVRT